VTASDISQLAEHVKATVVKRRNARGGHGAAEHLIAAFRCMYKYAVADGILTESENPAARLPKPRRLRSARAALPDSRLEEILRAAATTGDDPALDALLLRLHTETACRRGGALQGRHVVVVITARRALWRPAPASCRAITRLTVLCVVPAISAAPR
jgi:integrase/recombinase XerC